MKILVLMDISVTWFYEYFEIYREISVDILTQNINKTKVIKTQGNVRKKKSKKG